MHLYIVASDWRHPLTVSDRLTIAHAGYSLSQGVVRLWPQPAYADNAPERSSARDAATEAQNILLSRAIDRIVEDGASLTVIIGRGVRLHNVYGDAESDGKAKRKPSHYGIHGGSALCDLIRSETADVFALTPSEHDYCTCRTEVWDEGAWLPEDFQSDTDAF